MLTVRGTIGIEAALGWVVVLGGSGRYSHEPFCETAESADSYDQILRKLEVLRPGERKIRGRAGLTYESTYSNRSVTVPLSIFDMKPNYGLDINEGHLDQTIRNFGV